MGLPKTIADYIGGLTIGQGRHAGERFKLLGWQRRFLAGAFGQPDDAALSCGRAAGKTTFCAAIGCGAVDAGGPLAEPMGECLLVASSFDQGLIAFRHMLHFLQPTFEKYGTGPRGRFRIQDSVNRATITDRQTGARVRVLGSDPKRDPSAMQIFRAYRLNQGTADTVQSVLLDAATWQAAESLPEPDAQASDYVLGLDLGQNAAMSAAAAYFRDGRLEAQACFPELPSLSERGLAVTSRCFRLYSSGNFRSSSQASHLGSGSTVSSTTS